MNKKILRRSRRICLTMTNKMIFLQKISLLRPYPLWALPLSDGEQELGGR